MFPFMFAILFVRDKTRLWMRKYQGMKKWTDFNYRLDRSEKLNEKLLSEGKLVNFFSGMS